MIPAIPGLWDSDLVTFIYVLVLQKKKIIGAAWVWKGNYERKTATMYNK